MRTRLRDSDTSSRDDCCSADEPTRDAMTYMLGRSSFTLLFVVGCGTSDHHMPPDGPPAFEEAVPADIPQVVTIGGSVLAAPKIQPVFFANDAAVQAQVEDFVGQLKGSDYWKAIGTEYGVGDITVLPTIVATQTPPTTDAALQTFVVGQIDGGTWTYDANTIYSVFLPAGVVLTSPDGSKSCQDYGAYHDEFTGSGSKSIVYALIPRCDAFGGFSVLDNLTMSASHEWIEAATDPRVETTPAFGDSDPTNYIWAYTPGAEVGDYCEYLDAAYQKLVGNYYVQRIWSNAAAKAGHDPCVPVIPNQPYVGAAPILTDNATLEGFTVQSVSTKAVSLALNASKTIDVQLYSDAETPDFDVRAEDVAHFFGSPAELSFTWDKQTGHNGDTLHLTVKRIAAGTVTDSMMHSLGSEFVVVTSAHQVDVGMWWGFASN
jgi:hypothetical protein